MEQKEVKIVGISINEKFGNLKATSLKFDAENRLTVIKGEVGSGKSTLQKAIKLTAQGSQTLQDKTLLGDHVNIVTQLLDGEENVFVGCKSNLSGGLDYVLYSTDKDGKKIKDPVIDGKKATPAAYLQSLQTSLTWNLEELTSENSIVQRNILLKTYAAELEQKGVYFDKGHPKYPGSIIDKIEKAKEKRNFADMKRKEVGGIADDMSKKGIDFENRLEVIPTTALEENVATLKAKISNAKENVESTKINALNELKIKGLECNSKLKDKNQKIKEYNEAEDKKKKDFDAEIKIFNESVDKAYEFLILLVKEEQDANFQDKWLHFISENLETPKEPELSKLTEISFNDKGNVTSKPEDFEDQEIKDLLVKYQKVATDYVSKMNEDPEKPDTTKLEKDLTAAENKLSNTKELNKNAQAVNSFHDWRERNEEVKNFNKDYFLKLTEIPTGVKGLHICPEYTEENGEKIAKGNDIYLMYDGSYDTKYFNNPNKELRKLAAYSETQKPMICLLIQKHLLSKKPKCLPYLWIDNIPIDSKTKRLLDRMAEELNLWLFVNWTGDWDKDNIKEGEILIENGEIFEKIAENEI